MVFDQEILLFKINCQKTLSFAFLLTQIINDSSEIDCEKDFNKAFFNQPAVTQRPYEFVVLRVIQVFDLTLRVQFLTHSSKCRSLKLNRNE